MRIENCFAILDILIFDLFEMISIYTDGSCLGNPGRGGYGYVILNDGKIIKEGSGGTPDTTNNRMEMTAVIEALKALMDLNISFQDLQIYSDSQLVIRTLTDNWKKKMNQDLWMELDEVLSKVRDTGSKINFIWVRGHDGNTYNEIVNTLAIDAARKVVSGGFIQKKL